MTHRSAFQMAAILAAMTWLAASAAGQQPGPVTASDAWSRATTPGVSTGGVYVTLTSPSGDKLVGATSPIAGRAGVHEMQMDGNVMRMRPVQGGLELPAGRPVVLSPGSFHIMLEGLKAPLKPGATVPVHLTFEKAPPVDIEAQVQSIGASGPATAAKPAMPAMPGMKMKD